EAVYGVDLVQEQIRVAAGQPLSFTQDDLVPKGHAIECRINAEDPQTLLPQPGRIVAYHPPGGPGVRVDSAIYSGYTVPPFYDSLIAKLIVHDKDRERCIARLERSLAEFVIDGIPSSIPLLRRVLAEPEFRANRYDTSWLERFLARPSA
ncbi:MAG: acetyl-CoA carboxylase biotin carboxylase subunit, partial [Geminicoccaceae bacterium]|nr:acetyl-CoA carboxylase biotin carboxylase subunit [Geminicoccaceae bacterium]